MSFVVYDLETTGLTKGFDQFVQFAAVRTDAELNIVGSFQIRCRLMPHVLPSPRAMAITGTSLEVLTDPALPSHYEAVCRIRNFLDSWSPAIFLGFNSLSFDEEFLRHAFYQNLHRPYLTNTNGNARADVLNLCRTTAALCPAVLRPASDDAGRPSFKLGPLAAANGIAVAASHEAIADVDATLALCSVVRRGAPAVWSQFLRFSQKSSVESFLEEETAFLLSETIGNLYRTRLLTNIGRHSSQPQRHYCLDLRADLKALRRMSTDELAAACRSSPRPVVTLRSNAAPTLWAVHDIDDEHLAPFGEVGAVELARQVRDDRPFMERLRAAAESLVTKYPPSPHVEGQIYEGGFPSSDDEARMRQFHNVAWEERFELSRTIADERYRKLALRVVFCDRPDCLPESVRSKVEAMLKQRLQSPSEADVPWRCAHAALGELEALTADERHSDTQHLLASYAAYLRKLVSARANIDA